MNMVYCGGSFPFDYQEDNYREMVNEDYRTKLLGNASKLLKKSKGVSLKENLIYIGPFYFESNSMQDNEIVKTEINMIEKCTHTIFLLDEGNCPGTISELILATALKKQIAIFYINKGLTEETESSLHTPCWFPIIVSMQKNKNTKIFECKNKKDAVSKILKYIEQI